MADIGAMLREARMREHLDIAEFEARTKIRAKYLRALEDEEWSLLPGYTFTKAFLRTYADMLGLDGRTLVDEFKRQYPDPSEIELSPSPPSRRGRDRQGERGSRQSGPSGRALLIALLVVLVAAVVFVVHELDKKKTPPSSNSSTSTTTTTTTTTTTSQPPPTAASVALRLTAVTPVHVCLIGYVTAHGIVHQRLPAKGSATKTALLTPGARAPVYHDDHFRVSFSGGTAHMKIGNKTSTVDATAATVSYEVGQSGRRLLAASHAPHCQ